MLAQLTRLLGFFGLVLVGIVWINRSVLLFDKIIADGNSALVFLELSALTLPEITTITLPLAAFTAALYVTNRMAQDSELVVALATGTSPLRLARPMLVFGLLTGGLLLILTHFLVPVSKERLAERQAELARDQTARLLTPGQFAAIGEGLTLFIRSRDANMQMQDVFLQDARNGQNITNYWAQYAWFTRGATGGTQLILADGTTHSLRPDTQNLAVSHFERARYDLALLLPEDGPVPRSPAMVPTAELLRAAPELQQELYRSASQLTAEAHQRNAQAGLGAIAALIGFLPLMLGGYSRFGLAPQIGGAIGLVILIMGVDSAARATARLPDGPWVAIYGAAFAGVVISAFLALALLWPGRRRAA